MEGSSHYRLANLKLRIPGQPQPKGSWSVSKQGKFYPVSGKSKPWEELIRLNARSFMSLAKGGPIKGAVRLSLRFFFEKPKTVTRDLPSVRPDLDKLVRK